MTEPDEAPSRYLYVRVDDTDGALALDAERLHVSPAVWVRRAIRHHLWLREQYAQGARVLIEDDKGLLHEVRFPRSLT